MRAGRRTPATSRGRHPSSTFGLIAPFQLSADAGTGLGVGYDVALDCDRDGRSGRRLHRRAAREAGLYLVHDLTRLGPLATSSHEEVGPLPPWPGPWAVEGDDWRVWYPAVLDDRPTSGRSRWSW